MKPLVLTFLLFISLNSSAQTWLWAKEQPNDTIADTGSVCDPWSISIDKKGNVIDAGIFSGEVVFGVDTVSTPCPTCNSSFIAKFTPAGNIIWAKQAIASPSSIAFIWATAIDTTGNIYATGYFEGGTVSFPPYTFTTGTAFNIFLVKYDPNGNILWAQSAVTSSPNSANNNSLGVATDEKGNVFITGQFTDTLTFGTVTLINKNSRDWISPFIIKFDPNGNALWGHQGIHNGQDDDFASGVTTDRAGNAYIVGNYFDSITFGSYTLTNLSAYSNNDMFIVKYDTAGNVSWVNYASLNNYLAYCYGNLICSDGFNSIYISGKYQGPISLNSCNLNNTAYQNVYIAKYNSSGSIAWAISDANNSVSGAIPFSLSASKFGYLYICGTFNDSISFASNRLISTATAPSFLYKFDTSGHALCSSSIDNFNDDFNGVAADPLGDNVYFNGDAETAQTTFGDTTLYGGGEEWSFMAKWTCCTVVPVTKQSDTICKGSLVALSASGGTGYLWSPAMGLNADTIANPITTPTTNTTYYVTVTNGSCSAKDSVTVVVHPGPLVTLCCNTTIAPGNSVQLDATGGTSYTWAPTNGLSCDNCPNPVASPGNSTTYYVTIRTDSGCSITQQVTIDVNCGQPFIPSAFSPNGDGKNDMLYVRGDCINTMDFAVFDRWGNKIFETNDKNIGWDGRYKGSPMNTGSYSYYLHATLYDGSNVDKKGNVTLVR